MNNLTSHIRRALQNIYPPEEAKALTMMICCDMLGLNALDIYMGKDIVLSTSKQCELENIISRLQKNEPIQYIRGFVDFGGNMFRVAPGVLIPRPETVELVNCIVEENELASPRILDIGTGSGCIAVSLAKKMPGASVTAWDVSDEALDIAKQNSDALGVQVKFEKQDALSKQIDISEQYDVIVSNPPYIPESEKKDMHLNVSDWEPELALFVPDEDPLVFYKAIAVLGQKTLAPEGRIYFEINQKYSAEVSHMLDMMHYYDITVIKDFFKNPRIIRAKK